MDKIGRSQDAYIPSKTAPRAAAAQTAAGPVDTVTTGQSQKTEAELKSKIQRIEMLGKTFGGGQLTFQQGDAWSTAQSGDGAQVITYRAEDLVDHSSDYAVGKVLSEASKAKYSRWVIPSDLAQDESFMLLQNSVDTARTGNLIGARFPGAREFIAESVGQDLTSVRENYTEVLADKLVAKSNGKLTRQQALQAAQAMGKEIPKSLQFSNGVIQDWQQQSNLEVDPDVKKALDGVRSDLRQAYQPPRDTLREDLNEREIREQAAHSHELIKEKVWPAYQGLLQADVDKLAEQLSQPDENQKTDENKETDDQNQAQENKQSDDQKNSEAGGKSQSGGKPQAGGQPGAAGEPSASDSAGENQPPLDPAEQKALEEELAKNPQALEEAMKSMKPSSAGQANPALQKAMQQALQNNPQLQQQLQEQVLQNPELQKAAQEQLPDNQSLQQSDPKQLDQQAKDAINQALQENPELAQAALEKAKQDPAVKKAAAEALRQDPEFQKAVAEQMGKSDNAQGVEQALENPELVQAMEKAALQQPGLDQAMADQIAESGQQQSLQDALKQDQTALKQAMEKAAQSTSAQDAGVQQSVQQALAQNSTLKQQAQQQMLNNPELLKSALHNAPGNVSLQQAAASKDGRKLDAQAKEALKQALQDNPEAAQQVADKLKNDPAVQQAAAKALAKNQEFQKTLAKEMGQDPNSGRMGKAVQELQKDAQVSQALQKAAQNLPGLAEALAQAAVGSGDPAGEGKLDAKQAQELARQVMEEFAKEMNEKLETQQKDVRRKERPQVTMQESPQAPGPQRASQDGSISQTELQKLESLMEQKSELDAALESMRSEYDKIHGTVAPMADELAGELKNFLYETARPHYQRPLRDSGKKIDMRAAMSAQAKLERTGTYDSEIWLRRNNPTQRSQKFILLVDESGSMGGEKWVAALRAMVMSMEALDSLDIDFGVIGFSDKPRIHKGLNDNFDLDSRERIVGSLAQPMSGGTNDDQGIQTSIDMLLEQGDPEDEKIIIVITDGIGNKEAVKKLQEEYKDKFIHMIGVGIGPGMADVKDVYEDHAAVASLQDLPYELAEIVRRKIQGDD